MRDQYRRWRLLMWRRVALCYSLGCIDRIWTEVNE